MRSNLILLSALAVSWTIQASAITQTSFTASATVINFDDLTGGSCNLCGPSVTNQYAGFGAIFNNPSFPGQDTADTNLTPYIPMASAPNVLFVNAGGGNMTGISPFQIFFSNPVNMVGLDFASSLDAFLQVDAYGAGHVLLESLTYVGSPAPIGLEGFAGIQESSNIVELDLSYHPNFDTTVSYNFSIDNLEFQSSGQAPEPSTLAGVAFGIAGIVAARVRRRF